MTRFLASKARGYVGGLGHMGEVLLASDGVCIEVGASRRATAYLVLLLCPARGCRKASSLLLRTDG